MRPILFVLFLFAIGCSGPSELSRSVVVTGIDFRPYTEKGFLITPEKYTGEYQSIGMIRIDVQPATKKVDYSVPIDTKTWSVHLDWLVENLDIKMVIDEAYKAATKMGADALTDFSLSSRVMVEGYILVPTYEATGFAIKRTK